MKIISYGIDYVRFVINTELDESYIKGRLDYIDIKSRWYHGVRCVDISGDMLAVIRTVEDVQGVILKLSELFRVSRLDVYIDVDEYVLDSVRTPGTVIMNAGRIETVYSGKLTSRGNVVTFARAYDARAARHYTFDATRFECEYKRHKARRIINNGKWMVNPMAVAIADIKAIYGIDIIIDGVIPVEMHPRKELVTYGRERFYTRYGKNILLDVERMGLHGWATFVYTCVFCQAEEGDKREDDQYDAR